MTWLVLALLLLGRSHPVPSPLQVACNQLAAANPLTHASAAACYRCELHGSQYMFFATSGQVWACNDPRW